MLKTLSHIYNFEPRTVNREEPAGISSSDS
jgi:hypothetical protein